MASSWFLLDEVLNSSGTGDGKAWKKKDSAETGQLMNIKEHFLTVQ